MISSEKNDFDRVAEMMREALAASTGNMHEPREARSNSITITKDGALTGLIRLQRAIDHCHGLAESHRQETCIVSNRPIPK